MHDVLDSRQLSTGQTVIVSPYDSTGPRGEVVIVTVTPRWNDVGGRWADLTVRDTAGTVHTIDTRHALIVSREYVRDEWCPECRSSSSVTDEFPHAWYERDGEHATTILKLACGHDLQRGDRVIGAAPGAPYAGPQTVVAASTRVRDRIDAAARIAAEFDPWAGE